MTSIEILKFIKLLVKHLVVEMVGISFKNVAHVETILGPYF